jgi:hypothetical protein
MTPLPRHGRTVTTPTLQSYDTIVTNVKVLLISENRSTTLVSPFPLGLAFVAGALRRAGHEVLVLDFMFIDEWREKLRATLKDFRPEAIGLSGERLGYLGERVTFIKANFAD